MVDGLKGLRQVLVGEVQRAVVTGADLEARGALSLDATVAQAAGFVASEKVEVANHANGARFSSVLVLAKANSGELRIDGPGAHLVRPGEAVTLTAWVALKAKAASKHRPRLVMVDAHNTVTGVSGGPARVDDKAPPEEKNKRPRSEKRRAEVS